MKKQKNPKVIDLSSRQGRIIILVIWTWTIITVVLSLSLLWLSYSDFGMNEKKNEHGTKVSSAMLDAQDQKEQQNQSSVLDKANFKSWMDYRAISAPASLQNELQKYATTDAFGQRCIDNSPLIAIGSGWGASVGDYVIVHFDGASPRGFIVGDIKSDAHTDPTTHKIDTYNGSIIEFIVDSRRIPKSTYNSGNFSSLPMYSHPVTNIYQEVKI